MIAIKLQFFYLICLAFFVIIVGVILLERPILFGNKPISTQTAVKSVIDKININTAIKEELMLLSGIGDKKAQAIIQFRLANGKFDNIEQIKEVSGISDKLYNQIKDFITIE